MSLVANCTWPSLPPPTSRWALFLDLDEASEDADSGALIPLLGRSIRAFDGAVALLSSRSIDEIDEIVSPLRLPCAGVDGAERRSADGARSSLACDRDFLDLARAVLNDFSRRHAGLLVEDRGLALVLRTGRCPELASNCAATMSWLAEASGGGFDVRRSTGYFTLKPVGADRACALSAFLAESPFAGRRPVVMGGECCDVGAFRAAIERDGLSIGVGLTAPASMFRLDDSHQCRQWLAGVVA
jgi:trehalose 6-phosphate phosphatase